MTHEHKQTRREYHEQPRNTHNKASKHNTAADSTMWGEGPLFQLGVYIPQQNCSHLAFETQ